MISERECTLKFYGIIFLSLHSLTAWSMHTSLKIVLRYIIKDCGRSFKNFVLYFTLYPEMLIDAILQWKKKKNQEMILKALQHHVIQNHKQDNGIKREKRSKKYFIFVIFIPVSSYYIFCNTMQNKLLNTTHIFSNSDTFSAKNIGCVVILNCKLFICCVINNFQYCDQEKPFLSFE